MMFQPTLRNPH